MKNLKAPCVRFSIAFKGKACEFETTLIPVCVFLFFDGFDDLLSRHDRIFIFVQ